MQESSFVIELAYKLKRERLGVFGNMKMQLPVVDVDAMRAVWHVRFPENLNPLRFDTNLVQYSSIRYDPFRRVQQFLRRAMWEKDAWAGSKYKNILSSRKGIFRRENAEKSKQQAVRSAFPLPGNVYRFKKILLGQETPRISIRYASWDLSTAAHIGALIIGFFIAWMLIHRYRDIKAWLVCAAVLFAALILAHYLLGMHRRLVWGADLALLVFLAKARLPRTKERIVRLLHAPWTVVKAFSVRNLLFLLGVLFILLMIIAFPLLLSTAAMVILIFMTRKALKTQKEADHA